MRRRDRPAAWLAVARHARAVLPTDAQVLCGRSLRRASTRDRERAAATTPTTHDVDAFLVNAGIPNSTLRAAISSRRTRGGRKSSEGGPTAAVGLDHRVSRAAAAPPAHQSS